MAKVLALLCSPFPQLHRPIPGGTGEAFAVGRKGQSADWATVAFEGSEVSTGGQIPKLDGLVVAGAD